MKTLQRLLLFCFTGYCLLGASARDWDGFLEQQNPVWNTLPTDWTEAPFLGNGMLGIQLYQTGKNTLRVDIGRGDVQDHRLPVQGRMNDRCRLPIGYFELHTADPITGCRLTLDLYDAVLRGELQTEGGSFSIRAFVHAEEMVILVEVNPIDASSPFHWEWQPLPAMSPRWLHKRTRIRDGYPPNPEPFALQEKDTALWIQPLYAGGEIATAWSEEATPAGGIELRVTVSQSFHDASARTVASDTLERCAETLTCTFLEQHMEWWHRYYPQSFVSLPNPFWESFYWIQMYKLASATRADGMLIDNQGPWLQDTSWPGAWWNLNVQLSYWPTTTSNRHALGYSLVAALNKNREALIQAVPEAYRHDSAALGRETGQLLWGEEIKEPGTLEAETGHLTWALHNVWLLYRHTMDTAILRETLYPLLRRSINYYLHFLEEDADGILHLPTTWSPEYKEAGPDCSYDLALLRWGCQTLIESTRLLEITDPLQAKWEAVLAHLASYPVDDSGMMIAAGVPLTYGHRHYSHLLAFYPLYLLTVESEEATALMERSLSHWFNLEGVFEEQFAGYSFTGAASMAAAFGKGNEALEFLDRLRPRIFPNTLYGETDTPVPVIETPLSAAQSIHDMLLQSWGSTIRVFPALPDSWAECSFENLSAEGGFLISAQRKKGKTRWIRVSSKKGGTFILVTGRGDHPSGLKDEELASNGSLASGYYAIDLSPGEDRVLWFGERPEHFRALPVSHKNNSPHGPFGLH